MLRQYIEFFYPGSFVSESTVKEVKDREAPVTLPKGAYGYRYFSREEVKKGKEILSGSAKDHSPMTYYGEAFTLAQVKALTPAKDYSILVSNMECNKWSKVVRTVRGNFQPLNKGDKVLKP